MSGRRARRITLSLLAATVLPLACVPRATVADPCTTPLVEMSDWQEVGGSAFTMRLPRNLQREHVQGIDSEVGEWSGGDITIGYDYGRYSDRLETPPEGAGELSRCETTLAGRLVRIVRYRSSAGKLVVDAHWPAVSTPAEPRERGASNTLTIHSEARTPRDAETLLAIVHSVRFRK